MKPSSLIPLTVGVIITAVVVLTPSIPLGVAGSNGSQSAEWVWQRHAPFDGVGDAIERLLPAVIGGVVLFCVSIAGEKSLRLASRSRVVLLYAGLMVVTWFWTSVVQQTTPATHGEVKPYWIPYDPSASGYFYEAVYRMHSTKTFLTHYEDRMRDGDVLHVGTHPPGLFLLAKGCLNVCAASPTLVRCLQAMENRRSYDAFRYLERETGLTNSLAPLERRQRFARAGVWSGVRLTVAEIAALQLLSELSLLAITLTVLPIALLCHVVFDRRTAWRVCCLWGTLPCLAVFAPKSDVMFPLTCTCVLALAITAMAGRSRAVTTLAIPAGVILWLGMMMSLAHLPIVALLLAFVALRAWHSKGETLRRDGSILLGIMATVCAVCVWWSLATGCNILTVWRLNLTNHAGFYDQFPRTWWKWLLVNPAELALAIGVPLFFVAIRGAVCSVRQAFDNFGNRSSHMLAAAFCLAAGITFDALWLSGKNQGEAARLWCFLTPWFLIMAGQVLKEPQAATVARDNSAAYWRHLLIAQLVVATLTVSQVSGFSF